MKKTMIRKILGCVATVALAAGLVACGSDSTPEGQVTKGPVKGATVKDKDGVVLGITDENGKFPMSGDGPYTTSGGKYVDLATGVLTDAPALKAPAGAKNITPITTLVANNPNDTALLEMIKNFGISFDDPLTTVTAANKDAVALNECIGAAIVNIKKSGASDDTVKTFLTAVALKVRTLTVTSSGNMDLEQIEIKMKDAATASLPSALATSVTAALTATYDAAVKLKEGEALPTVTGTTGTTGGTSVK